MMRSIENMMYPIRLERHGQQLYFGTMKSGSFLAILYEITANLFSQTQYFQTRMQTSGTWVNIVKPSTLTRVKTSAAIFCCLQSVEHFHYTAPFTNIVGPSS